MRTFTLAHKTLLRKKNLFHTLTLPFICIFSEHFINEEDENASLSDMQNEGANKPQDIHLADIYHYVVAKAPQSKWIFFSYVSWVLQNTFMIMKVI